MVNIREPLDPKISLCHFLAYYLPFQREKQGLSLAQWRKIIGAARSTVSNIEAGRLKMHDDQAKILDETWDTGGLFSSYCGMPGPLTILTGFVRMPNMRQRRRRLRSITVRPSRRLCKPRIMHEAFLPWAAARMSTRPWKAGWRGKRPSWPGRTHRCCGSSWTRTHWRAP